MAALLRSRKERLNSTWRRYWSLARCASSSERIGIPVRKCIAGGNAKRASAPTQLVGATPASPFSFARKMRATQASPLRFVQFALRGFRVGRPGKLRDDLAIFL